jgi:TRAP-type C4-dicarboxylate transport system permease large subunit
VNVPIRVSVGGGRRSNGIVARHITAKIAGTPPDTYSATSRITIPALTEAFYNAAVAGGTLTYLSTTWTITGKREELTA